MTNSISRRKVFGTFTAASAALGPLGLSAQEGKAVLSPAPTRNGRSALTPDQALQLLQSGNQAFMDDRLPAPDIGRERRLALAKGQAPFCAYVSCSDSRVPPELLFGRGLGELFIIRNAGNTVDTVAMGSIEYAVTVLGAPLIVVMGHEACGAVKAAIDVVEKNARFPGAIDDMIQPIIPAVLESRGATGDAVEAAIKQNVRRVVRTLREESDPILLRPQQEKKVKVVGAYYRLSTGKVDFFDTV